MTADAVDGPAGPPGADGGPRPPLTGRDAGVSLVEVLVGLTLLGVVLALSTSAVVQMYGAANRAEAIGTAQAQLAISYQRLDREIRYASDVTVAGTVGGVWYVEYLTAAGDTAVCTQLRLHSDKLQRRTWTHQEMAATASGWTVLASQVRATAAAPFESLPTDADTAFERLRVRLASTAGAGSDATSSETDMTFTAMNTIRDDSEPTDCTEGRSAP